MKNFTFLFFLLCSISLFGQPVNDDVCSPELLVSCNFTSGTTINATSDNISSPGLCNNSDYTGVFFNYINAGNTYLQIKLIEIDSIIPVEIIFGKWVDECDGIFQVLGEYCGIAGDAEINIFGVEDEEYIIYVSTPSSNQSDFDIHICFDPLFDCEPLDECSEAFDFGIINSSSACNSIGCNLNVGDNGSLGNCDHEGIIWCKFITGSDDFQTNIQVTAADNGIPIYNIYSGNCGNLTPLDNCQQGSSSFGNIYDLSASTTYYIGVSTLNYPVKALNVCISQYGLSGGEQSMCTIDDEIEVKNTSFGSPLNGPFQPCETVEFCVRINEYSTVFNNCQWLQGIIPVFGNGWDPSSFNTEGMPIITQNIQPYSNLAEWNWYSDVTYNYTLTGSGAKKSIGDFDMDGDIEMCSHIEDDCPNTGTISGQLSPPGWYAWRDNFMGQSGHPNVDYGDGDGCNNYNGPWEICFELIANCDPDCNIPGCDDTSLKVYTTSDAETGDWGPGPSICINDEPAIFKSTVEKLSPIVSSLSTEYYGSFVKVLNNSSDNPIIEWNVGSFSPARTSTDNMFLQSNSIFLIADENSTVPVSCKIYSGIQEASESSIVSLDYNPTLNVPAYEICEDQILNINYESTNELLSQIWHIEGGTIISQSEGGIEVLFNTPGSYDIELEYIDLYGNSGTEIFSDHVTVDSLPIIISADGYFNDLNVEFSANVLQANELLWDFGDGNTSTGTNPTHIYNDGGIYDINLIATNDCGITEHSFTLDISIIDLGPNYYICPGDTFVVHYTIDGGLEYVWECTANVYEVYTPTSLYAIMDSVPEEVYLAVYFENGESHDTLKIDLNYTEASFNYELNHDTLILENTSTYYDDYYDYDWNISGIPDTILSENPIIKLAEQGSYEIQLITSNGCNQDTAVQEIIYFTDTSLVHFIYSKEIFCNPDTVTFIDTFNNGSEISRIWYFEGGDPETSNDSLVNVNYSIPGMYDVRLVRIIDSVEDTILVEDAIDVKSIPESGFQYNESLDSFINSSLNATNFFWDFGDGMSSTVEYPYHKYEFNGNYIVTLITENECGYDTLGMEIAINHFPEIHVKYSQDEFCNPLSVTFIDTFNNGTQLERTWYFEGGNPETSSNNPVIVEYTNPGVFDYSLTSSNSYGIDEQIFSNEIIVYEMPLAKFSYNHTLDSFINLSTEDVLYFWDFGDGITSNEKDPNHKYFENGEYIVTLTVTTDYCESEYMDTINVIIVHSINYQDSKIKIYPNPIINDAILYIEGLKLGEYRFIISDISGNVIQKDLLAVNSQISNISLLEGLPNGVYNIIIEGSENIFRERFIKAN